MASVVFSVEKDDAERGEKQIELLHLCFVSCIEGEAWEGIQKETRRLRDNGVRIGHLLETPRGSLKPEWSFAFQCWDTSSDDLPYAYNSGNDLRRVAQKLYCNKPAFKKIRAVGIE